MGDTKLFTEIALFTELYYMVPVLVFSLFLSFAEALILLLTKKKSRKDTIPFGPCILCGTILAMILSGA